MPYFNQTWMQWDQSGKTCNQVGLKSQNDLNLTLVRPDLIESKLLKDLTLDMILNTHRRHFFRLHSL